MKEIEIKIRDQRENGRDNQVDREIDDDRLDRQMLDRWRWRQRQEEFVVVECKNDSDLSSNLKNTLK